MGKVRVRKETGKLQFDFFYQGVRCREQTLLEDTPANRQKMEAFMAKIDREIAQGSFDYAAYFPDSSRVKALAEGSSAAATGQSRSPRGSSPLFATFSEEWYQENEIAWKISYQQTVRGTLGRHLIPHFGQEEISRITKGDILKFRSTLAKVQNGNKIGLSPDRINHIMTTLRQILNDAADRFHFSTPFTGIKPLKVSRTQVDPFTLEEVQQVLSGVRSDYRDYYLVRFYTALRTGEIDGLQWKYVDFERRQILIRETLVQGRVETTKTPGSIRDIQMAAPVFEALQRQWALTGQLSPFVFCNRNGEPLDHRNVTKRVWYPTLEYLGLKRRRPYQTRHTMATLWLAAGENPEWIARQMGHTSTEMLFTVYSRFIPNLTWQDGSAFETLLAARMNGGAHAH